MVLFMVRFLSIGLGVGKNARMKRVKTENPLGRRRFFLK